MNSEARLGMRTAARAMAAPFAVLLLASCSGPSTYHSSANPPIAVAHVVGAQPTSAAGADPVTVTVRSQSQVTLTGNASSGGDAAIGTFVWTQTDSAPTPQPVLLYLDSDTVTFTAPTVGSDTTLHFTLTVTTAGNAAVTAHVVVLVKAINDPNQFLALLPTTGAPTTTARHHFKVAVATVEGLPAPLATDAPVCVTVTRTIDYMTRNRTPGAVKLTPLQADTKWTASIGGAAGDFASYTNPKVAFEIPALNQDDIFVLYNNPVPAGGSAATNLSLQLVPADVDTAQLSLVASAGPGPCAAPAMSAELTGKTLQVQVEDEAGAAVGSPGASATFTPDNLVSQQAGTPYETAETARAYYAAIDPPTASNPNGSKTTLTAWLTANCFDPSKSDFGADAHGVYTNNFDLGFGRDMYFTTCKAGSPHAGDMASVVINYASLEAAASKLNPVIAVAMEYSPATNGSSGAARFTKFYVFAPDDRDGIFYRISSANFDHRGEKYVPGACIMCHGGHVPSPPTANFVHSAPTDYPTIADPTAAATGQLGLGDVDAAFLPWDLDSFLYASAPLPANTDPTFVGLSVDPSLFSRSAQEPNLKKLNQLAYCTYQPEMEKNGAGNPNVDRYNALRALVGRWYGGAPGSDGVTYPVDVGCMQGGAPTAGLLPNATYDDTGTPAGWTAKPAPQQQPGVSPSLTSDMIFHQVFSRNCRSCHTANAVVSDQFADYPSFIQMFQSPLQKVNPPSVPGNGIKYTFLQGRMPLARLTMDRFWVDYAGGESAAQILATHVEQVNGETDLITPATCDLTNAAACQVIGPGAPLANLNVTVPATAPLLKPEQISLPSYGAATTMPITAGINRFGGVLGDASTSFFIGNFGWTLCRIPTGGGACAPQDLVGAQSAMPGFLNDSPGMYQLTLAADNGLGGPQAQTKYVFTVPGKNPSLAGCPALVSLAIGPTSVKDFSGCITSGDEPAANIPNAFEILDPALDPALPGSWKTSVAAATWNASTTASATFNGTNYVYSYGLSFTFNGSAIGDAIVNYRVRDADGGVSGTANGMITYHLTDTLTAGGITLQQAPAASYTVLASSLGNNIVPASAASSVTMVVPANFGSGAGGLPATVSPPNPLFGQFPLGGSLASYSVPANGSFVFTPPQASSYVYLNCDVQGFDVTAGSPTACSGNTFGFYLLAADLTTTSANVGEVNIKVQAQTSFSRDSTASNNVYVQLGNNCSAGCHAYNPGAAAGSTSALAQAAWIYYSTDINATYNSLISLIAKGSAGTSAFYEVPCVTHDFPAYMNFSSASAECVAIYNWINEGAYND